MDYILPNYVPPCTSEKSSIESRWLYDNDFGECLHEHSDIFTYPRVIPVYNGQVLNIDTDFVHASLSGISIKHYYGKCFEEKDEEENEEKEEEEKFLLQEDFYQDWYNDDIKAPSQSSTNISIQKQNSEISTGTSSGNFDYRESFYTEGQPLCTLAKINNRNSFWNIHRPELSKLTWGQNYVGASTVIEHLHEHLIQHGYLCEGYHTVEDRNYILNKELNEYVRLKPIACPRQLPPDEPLFNFKETPRISKLLPNPKCKSYNPPPTVLPLDKDRCVQLSDDEVEITEKIIHRSKEEFCITIGKHIRKPPITQPEPSEDVQKITYEYPYGEAEGEEGFLYNWFLYTGEEYEYTVPSSVTVSIEDLRDPCSPHILDEFCKAAGKVDFSDIRCNPDF